MQPLSKNITLISFGYSFGQPKYADLIIDARNFMCAGKELRKKYTGLSKAYQDGMYHMDIFVSMYDSLKQQIETFIALSNRSDIAIAIGCHRGRHRSVAIVEKLKIDLVDRNITTQHTNINKKYSDKKQEFSTKRDIKYEILFDD